MGCLLSTVALALIFTVQALHDELEIKGLIYNFGYRGAYPRKYETFATSCV